jgi:hypothetical protein
MGLDAPVPTSQWMVRLPLQTPNAGHLIQGVVHRLLTMRATRLRKEVTTGKGQITQGTESLSTSPSLPTLCLLTADLGGSFSPPDRRPLQAGPLPWLLFHVTHRKLI